MGSILDQNRVIARDVKSCTYCCYVRCATLIVWVRQAKTGATQYNAPLGLPDKGHVIKGLVVCNNKDLEPWNLLNGLALGWYQPSPEVCRYAKQANIQPARNKWILEIALLCKIRMTTSTKSETAWLYEKKIKRICWKSLTLRPTDKYFIIDKRCTNISGSSQ